MIKYNLKWLLDRQAEKEQKMRLNVAFIGILLMEVLLFIVLIK